jgi:glycosyltransferase A (GT-A) superfamily protein (DUF2064 family)
LAVTVGRKPLPGKLAKAEQLETVVRLVDRALVQVVAAAAAAAALLETVATVAIHPCQTRLVLLVRLDQGTARAAAALRALRALRWPVARAVLVLSATFQYSGLGRDRLNNRH